MSQNNEVIPTPTIDNLIAANGPDHEEAMEEMILAEEKVKIKKERRPPTPEESAYLRAYMKKKYEESREFRIKYRHDDLNSIRPLEIDESGLPVRPKVMHPKCIAVLNAAERKVRFVRMYNWSCGVISVSCADAGITRAKYEQWIKEDELFRLRLKDTHKEISDRMLMLMNMNIGLVKKPKEVDINAAMLKVAMKMRPDIYEGMEEAEDEPGNTAGIAHSIPRPAGTTAQPG